jgi:hypothetical protein
MQIQAPDISDYNISYAGHGMIEHATKTNSIAHVVAHENRHLDHFESYARFHGKEIIREDISIRYEYVDGKIVAVAGKATAAMRDKPVEQQDQQSELQTAAPKSLESPTISQDSARKAKIDALLGKIEMALRRVEKKLESTEKNAGSLDSRESGRLASIRARKLQLEAKKKEVQKTRNELTAEKMQEVVKELLGGAAALISQSANLVRAIYGLKSGNEIDEAPDKNNEVLLPDYSMLCTGTLLDTVV